MRLWNVSQKKTLYLFLYFLHELFKLKWMEHKFYSFLVVVLTTMKRIPPIFYNKYFLTIVGLFLWLLILDETDLTTLYKYRSNVEELEGEKEFLKNQIVDVKESLNALSNNPKELERFAREHHYMKKSDEDLFVIINQ